MIVVEVGALIEREMRLRMIVGVEGDDFGGSQVARELAGQRGFAGTGESRDTD